MTPCSREEGSTVFKFDPVFCGMAGKASYGTFTTMDADKFQPDHCKTLLESARFKMKLSMSYRNFLEELPQAFTSGRAGNRATWLPGDRVCVRALSKTEHLDRSCTL